MKTVLLKLSGPLQSWGTDSHFETRHTDDHPSKSGVIGMIASGLGIRRDDEDSLKQLQQLDFAVRIDQYGQIQKDFHTVKMEKKLGHRGHTYITKRYYLQDAVFVVALGSDHDDLINDVERAVKKPYFQNFLGRRALPPTADLFQGILETDVISALKEYPWQASEWYKKRHNSRIQIYADGELLQNINLRLRNDEAVSFSQKKGRRFNPRRESHITVDAVFHDLMKEEHDAFGALGEK